LLIHKYKTYCQLLQITVPLLLSLVWLTFVDPKTASLPIVIVCQQLDRGPEEAGLGLEEEAGMGLEVEAGLGLEVEAGLGLEVEAGLGLEDEAGLGLEVKAGPGLEDEERLGLEVELVLGLVQADCQRRPHAGQNSPPRKWSTRSSRSGWRVYPHEPALLSKEL
jgi:hypothetical protein